jgi:hypothetical protein
MVGLLFFQCDELFECSVGEHDGKRFVVCCLKVFEVVVFCKLKCEIGVVFWKPNYFCLEFRNFCWYGVVLGVIFLDLLVRTQLVPDRIGVGPVVSRTGFGLDRWPVLWFSDGIRSVVGQVCLRCVRILPNQVPLC